MVPTVDYINVMIHGLFFMTLDPATNNLSIYAPNIPDHHFVGGVRGRRIELNTDVNWSNIGLIGGSPQWQDNDSSKIPSDVPGSIFQFTKTETGVGEFTGDSSKYKGKITLPWPAEWYSLRCDDIDKTFHYDPRSTVGSQVELNCRRKSKLARLGIVTCLRYGYAAIGLPGWARQLNIHFYCQPCTDHFIPDVNNDLATAAHCFTNYKQFDLRMIEDPQDPLPKTPIGLYKCEVIPPGVTLEDELSLNEDHSLDILSICPVTEQDNSSSPPASGVSPANCPHFYVGP